MAKKKSGCNKGQVKFHGRCYPKVLCEPKYQLNWNNYPMDCDKSGNEIQTGCQINSGHTIARCNIPSIMLSKHHVGKIFLDVIRKGKKRKTQEIQYIPDPEAYTPEPMKIGHSTFSSELILGVMQEIHGHRLVTKNQLNGKPTKTAENKKFNITYWQDPKKDTPIVIEGNSAFYVIAPRAGD